MFGYILLSGLMVWGGVTFAAPSTSKLREQHSQTREQQQALHEKLRGMQKELARSEASRNEVTQALAETERVIANSNRKLGQVAQQINQTETELRQIKAEQEATQQRLGAQQQHLASLVKRQYSNGSPDQFRLFLNGDNPSRTQRELQYLGYLSQANAASIQDMRANLAHLNKLRRGIAEKLKQLASLRQSEESEKQNLLAEQNKRQRLLGELAQKISAQKRTVGMLQRDEARLSRLIDNLSKLLTAQAEKERRARAQDKARQQPRQPSATRDTSSTPAHQSEQDKATSPGYAEKIEESADGNVSGDFGSLRGRLKLPLRGELLGRFGAPRNQIGSQGGTTWKGLFIRAQAGAEVRAVAGGRVIFAEWLRGFGNLLILDHGAQYLSIYGNNEALFKRSGERIRAGEVIASVGNSGDNSETGLYFELRYRGQPFDPMQWVGKR